MKKVFITGASGFIGANLTRRLLHDGHEVHLLLRKGYKSWRIQDILKDTHIYFVDFQNKSVLKKIFSSVTPDWIFHTAVYGAYSRQTDFSEMVQTNILGMHSLLSAACEVGFESFVNTGSSSEYGYKKTAPKETEHLDPNSPYAVTKAAATHLCRLMAEQHKLHIPTLRLYSVYGPYEEPTRLIPTLLLHAHQHTLPKLVDPKVARDFVYVEDVVDAYVLAAQSKTTDPGDIFNIGTGTQTTLASLVSTTRKLFQISQKPVWGSMPNRNWDTSTWIADNAKAKKVLRWKPKHSLKQGLVRTYRWLDEHKALYKVSLNG